MTPTLEKRIHTSARAFVRALARKPLAQVWPHVCWPGDRVACHLVARKVGSSWTMRWHLGGGQIVSHVKRQELLYDHDAAFQRLVASAKAEMASSGDRATR